MNIEHIVVFLTRILAECFRKEHFNVHYVMEVAFLPHRKSANACRKIGLATHMEPQFHLPVNVICSIQEPEAGQGRHEPTHSSALS